jgi:dipeptidyl aminopeptidase/acylaminoacyl peptidase
MAKEYLTPVADVKIGVVRTSLICFFLLGVAAAATRPIAETDLYAFRWLADPQIAPDGAQIVYTLVNVNAKHDGYETTLWTVSTNGGSPRQMTAGPHDSSLRWSPDGKRLAFLRSLEKDGKPQPPQIYVLPMNGGEARAWTDLPKGAGAPVWSLDGKRIAFTSTTLPTDSAKEEETSDVRVINRAVYRDNGEGYYDFGRPPHIWMVEEAQKPQQLTSSRYSEEDPVWSRDGSRIYFFSVRELEAYYSPPYSELYRRRRSWE